MCIGNLFKKDPSPIGPNLSLVGYSPTFLYDFTREPLDWTKWTHAYPGGQDQKEKTRWVRENVVQDEMGVHLIATRGDGVNLNGQLSTHQFLETLYGYTYYTAKVTLEGLLYFCALWGYNRHGWQPEIDIAEWAGKLSNEIWFTHHYVLPPDLLTDHSKGINRKWEKTYFHKEFHEFGVLWTPTSLTWYVDRKPFFTVTENIPQVPIFWVAGIQAGMYPPYTRLLQPQESDKMVLRDMGIYQLK